MGQWGVVRLDRHAAKRLLAMTPRGPTAMTRLTGCGVCDRNGNSLYSAISSLIRLASVWMANGLVSTCMPGSKCPPRTTALSA
jgi:hypothetical protein